MLRVVVPLVAAAVFALAAPSAEAGDGRRAPGWTGHHGYAPSWWSQRDRPGDNRCDAFWDANRDDCHDRWRNNQRSYQGYGRGHGHRYDYGRYAAGPQADVWPGAYGRPDLVYPASGHGVTGYGAAGRNPDRSRWCAQRYRSYDPASGYYRAYSGRLIYCG